MVTIKEIANQLGVSMTTVSNVIHGKTSEVSPATIEMVQKALKESGYVPNMGARNLAQNQSKIIGVVMKERKGRYTNLLCDPFYGELVGAIEKIIRTKDYYLMMNISDNMQDTLKNAATWNVDGVIMVSLDYEDVLELRTISVYSDFELCGPVPPGLCVQNRGELGISISLDESYDPFPRTLHLVPRITVLGIGCKKGTPAEKIERLVKRVMEQNQLSMHSLAKVASIDLKKEEPGLLEFCGKYGLPLLTYTAEELSGTEHEEELSESEFVKQVTGVGSVCERSALRASGRKRLLQGKTAADGVTLAIAVEKYTVNFG